MKNKVKLICNGVTYVVTKMQPPCIHSMGVPRFFCNIFKFTNSAPTSQRMKTNRSCSVGCQNSEFNVLCPSDSPDPLVGTTSLLSIASASVWPNVWNLD